MSRPETRSQSEPFPRSGHVIAALVICYGCAAVMAIGPLAYLHRISGGLAPFDLRPFGYTVAEARAYLVALSDIGRTYYADVQLQLDTAFPSLFMLSHGLLLMWLTAQQRTSDRPLSGFIRAALLVFPTGAAAFDYLENDGIAAMLAAGPTVSADIVERTSQFTQTKFILLAVTQVICIALGAIALKRWRHRRPASR